MYDYYVEEIERIGESLDRLVTSSLIAYDEAFHNDIINDTNILLRELKDDEELHEQEKNILTTLLMAHYRVAVEDINKK